MFGIDPTIFGNTRLAWIWYGQGGALVVFSITTLIAFHIFYSSQWLEASTTLWRVISAVGWILVLPGFLLAVDGMMFSTQPFAARLSETAVSVMAGLGVGGGVLGLLAFLGYVSKIGMREEGPVGPTMRGDTRRGPTDEVTPLWGEQTGEVPPSERGVGRGGFPGPMTVGPSAGGGRVGEPDATVVSQGARAGERMMQEPVHTVVLKRKHLSRELAWLVQITGVHQGRAYRLGRVTEIGRDPAQNQIVVDDETASAIHAVVRLQDGEFVIQDRGSANGTFVNGEEVVRRMLRDHDIVKIGDSEFVFLQVNVER